MRVAPGELDRSVLLDHARAVLYLEPSDFKREKKALERFVARGGKVVTAIDLEGIATTRLDTTLPFWDSLPEPMKPTHHQGAQESIREERDPIFADCTIRELDSPTRTLQRFAFDVDLTKPMVALLPMIAVPGWRATLDGKPFPSFPTLPHLLGVSLPAGAHRLVFTWAMPGWHRATLFVSLLALVVVLGSWISWPRRGGKRRRIQ